jgi:uncharacterized protein (TIGR00288 family)
MNQQPHAHLQRPAHKEPPAHAPNAALLIDFDNMTMGIRSDLHTELKRLLQSEIIRGKVAVQRAYADWRRYHQYIVPLSESSIDLIFAPAYGSNKKNATDIRLAIDALELVFTRPEIGTFILLSGDSDFSSLVIKLKEYGKYVIGVGIRESSSDLLIQNCDEYYSYNELAGFTKETDATHEPRDPWELVVEAVKQMTAHNDVMRSDRLKQVMQEIDPNFDEKNAGRFSRFSQFVTEAARRGLINVTRLDNGQYEVELGPAGRGSASPGTSPSSTPAAADEPETPSERREDTRRRRSDDGGERRPGFSLAETFGALKQALRRFGGQDAVNADELRAAMGEIPGTDAAALDPGRFPRLLRQAHDAEIIDLSKEEDGAYAVRLREETSPAPAPAEMAGIVEDESDPPMPASSAPPPPYSQAGAGPTGARPGAPSRSARFRRGSRGGRPAAPGVPKIGAVEVDPNYRPRSAPPTSSSPGAPVGGGVRDMPGLGDREEGRDSHRGGRGRGGRGGRGRGREGGREGGGREGSGGREGGGRARGEGPAGGSRDESDRPRRGRRGGRGRGRGRGENGGTDVHEPRLESERATPPSTPAASAPSAPPPKPPATPSTAADHQESFWSRVKRGLIGE